MVLVKYRESDTVTPMLTDTKLKSIKPTEKPYKLSDRDGLYIYVTKKGTVSFRYDYTFNKKRSTIVLGQYGTISLAEAREALLASKKLLQEGIDPSALKREKSMQNSQDAYFGYWTNRYIAETNFAESTRKLRTDTYNRNMSAFDNRLLDSISTMEIRQLCE